MSSPDPAYSGPAPVLTDGSVTLRAPHAHDREATAEYLADPEMRRWDALPVTDAAAWPVIAEVGWSTGERYQFVIEVDGRLIGDLNLRPQGGGLALVGFGLIAGRRGRGLMTRALRLALPWGFDTAGIDLVHWRAGVGNWPSRRAAWAVGFRVDGVVPGLTMVDGRRVDGWLGALRRGDRLEPAHPWSESVTVCGRSVVLRPHDEGDVPRVVEACRDPQTRHWLIGLPDDYGPAHARQYLEQVRSDQAAGRAVYWAIADPQDNRLLGDLGLFIHGSHDRQGEIGYWAHPEARGRGVTTEGVRLAARHALLPMEDGGLGLSRVLIRTDENNVASQRVAERAGFTRTGRDRAANRHRDGSRADHLRFDLLPDELTPVR